MPVSRWWAELAWTGGESAQHAVLLEASGPTLTGIRVGVREPPADAVPLRGLVLPGLADAHVHCFHRALRAVTQTGAGDFWSWRGQMYAVAARLTPSRYYELARAAYAELALAGVTCVGEFHYVHHRPDGTPYEDPNAMAQALAAGAADAGVRLTLLDACYLTGGFGARLDERQRRFGDGSARRWAQRVELLARGRVVGPAVRVGAAIHSVRAVPADDLPVVAAWARERALPLHVHVSEQPAENADCLAAHGCTPSELLDRAGALGVGTTVVHATHVTDTDVALLGAHGVHVAMCPTTERDLADGLGRARELADAGCPIVLGSDSNAVADLLEEARAVEHHERLRTGRRGHWRAAELLAAATVAGHCSLGWPEVGRLAVGAPADFVCLALDTVRTAGAPRSAALEAAVFAGAGADVTDVVVAGEPVVVGGVHQRVRDVPGALATAIAALRASS